MARVKGGPRAHAKHKKVLKLAKGYRGTRNRLFRRAQEGVIRAGEHAFEGRKQRKRDMRRLWITRLSAALIKYDVKYSRFIAGLKRSGIVLNRKMLSEMAINEPKDFEQIVNSVKKG
ncbi:50S ribosomal protein L20 [candidate division WWE3 bacterium RIFOXYC2_FULL_42_13]|uniref:Large ribosomal subunit protein bL20 n=1 Tax=candidate division WWE3 bacterium TaxID=2053526 RepID=A0A3D0ZNW6_UNCKA|nr:MAG: 50S ribosomal protein L20 [candidate division WWE3 bacterium RIFOXYA2_FULL_43_12]OGC65655.1 MAG: 50S ribosomal protein L20 [candidate division WWE3 bacterium RIFOXYA12_FULL_43_11]OGC72659.1 MAG: 50S ribosomal protein L20 [candidate division WWE3 bacterium RIFOXYC2_FULL_42_13]OGC73972.1 MAG: 50S ribosomal protein L20 [candidate division WWE3 bacterium RIFOXYB2_FULL_43_9]OGC75031.1 MAG: 50S ribosomal protein L20 [candidate division WWE3 bacterium RIFOXYD2_FULL_43_10]HBY09734.1 50S riboso